MWRVGAAHSCATTLWQRVRRIALCAASTLVLTICTAASLAGEATLSWSAPTHNEDGTLLTDLAGYNLYAECGSESGYPRTVQNLPSAADSYVWQSLPDNTECRFVATAFNSADEESQHSGVATYFIDGEPQAIPGAITNLVVTWESSTAGGGVMADAVDSILGSEVVDASGAASSSANITVPSGTAAIIVFTGMWDGGPGDDVTSVTIDGDSVDFTAPLQNQATTTYGAHVGIGALLSPSIGTVSLAWAWSDTAPDEGGEIIAVYLNNDFDVSSIAALVGDSDVDLNNASGGGDAMQLTLTSSTGQVGLAYAQRFSGSSISITPDDNTLEDDQSINSHRFEVVAFDADAGSTTVDMAVESYSSIGAIVLNPAPEDGGDIAATVDAAVTVAADLDASGALAGDLSTAISVAADLSASGDLDGALSIVTAVAATLASQGDLEAALAITSALVADLDAVGSLSAEAASQLSLAADLTALGDVAAVASVLANASGTLTNASNASITASLPIVADVVADLIAQGELDAAIALAISVAADLRASGDLQGAAAAVTSLSGELSARGELSADLAIAVSLSAALSAMGDAEGSISAALSVVPDLSFVGDGGLNAAVATAFSIVSELSATGALAATPAIVFDVAGDLEAEGALQSTINSGFDVTADGRLLGRTDAVVPTVSSITADITSGGGIASSVQMQSSVAAVLLARGGLLATVALQSSVLATIFDASAERIPNSTQQILVSLFNAVQSLTAPDYNSRQNLDG